MTGSFLCGPRVIRCPRNRCKFKPCAGVGTRHGRVQPDLHPHFLKSRAAAAELFTVAFNMSSVRISPSPVRGLLGAVAVAATTFVTASPATVSAAGEQFGPIVPARVSDSRKNGHPVNGGTQIQIPDSVGREVPSRAVAVSLNITVTQPFAAGFVTVWPCGAARPNASTLNFAAGETRANQVLAKLGSDVPFRSPPAATAARKGPVDSFCSSPTAGWQ